MLKVEGLNVEVRGKQVLHDIDLDIPEGSTYVLFGPNGSGKSTLLATIMGFSQFEVTSGRIFFRGKDITDAPIDERARLGIGMLMQRPPNIPGVRLRSVLKATSGDGMDVERAAGELNMDSFLERDINVGFSGGELKRSEILQLQAQGPCFLMMDEPESGVDLVSIQVIGKKIRDLIGGIGCGSDGSGTIRSALIITHTGQILDFIEAQKAFVLANGTIQCSGSPDVMFERIRRHGYEECIRCHQRN